MSGATYLAWFGSVPSWRERTHQSLRKLVDALASLDATIQAIDPSIALERTSGRIRAMRT